MLLPYLFYCFSTVTAIKITLGEWSMKKRSDQTIPQTIEIRISGGYSPFFKAPQMILICGRAELFYDLGQVTQSF